jgi:hypothetical protein
MRISVRQDRGCNFGKLRYSMPVYMAFVLSNFTFSFFILGLITAAVSVLFSRELRSGALIIEKFYAHFLLFSMGVSFVYNFVMHVFFAEMVARFIGWANSPFQYEVGYASLGMGLIGILAFRKDLGLRLAALLGPTCFLWGAAVGHIILIVREHDFAAGNAGMILYTDLLLPLIGWVLFGLSRRTMGAVNAGSRSGGGTAAP